jgi:ribosome-associated heat shock protein Hsp15
MSIDGQRLDRWLWCARFYKSRNVAADEVKAGHVRLNGRRVKPAHEVKLGDELAVIRVQSEMDLVVTALPARRGPAIEAQACYQETGDSAARRAAAAARRAHRIELAPPTAGRPDKRTRRLIRSSRRPD